MSTHSRDVSVPPIGMNQKCVAVFSQHLFWSKLPENSLRTYVRWVNFKLGPTPYHVIDATAFTVLAEHPDHTIGST